jgi:hypothetical protein
MKVVEYANEDPSEPHNGFRMTSFYFYGRRCTHKLVMRFDRRTVTLSRRMAPWGPWVELKAWSFTA